MIVRNFQILKKAKHLISLQRKALNLRVDAASILNAKNEDTYAGFPWRSSPKNRCRSLVAFLKSLSSYVVKLSLFSPFIAEDLHIPSNYWSKDFPEGVRDAMQISALSIFHSVRWKSKTAYTTHDILEKQSTETQNVVTDFVSIFDVKLAAFYEMAIEHAIKSKYEVTFELLEVGLPTYSLHDSIFFANRNIDMKGLIRVDDLAFFGCCVDVDTLAVPVNHKAAQYATIRIWMDVPCKERFCVRDSVTGDVIQGSTDVVESSHEILLETILSPGTSHFSWKVVDIDDWLSGNEFWETGSLYAKKRK